MSKRYAFHLPVPLPAQTRYPLPVRVLEQHNS